MKKVSTPLIVFPFHCFYKCQTINMQKKNLFNVNVKTDFNKVMSIN